MKFSNAYVKMLAVAMTLLASSAGSANPGYSQPGYPQPANPQPGYGADPLEEWCNNALRVLENARESAMSALSRYDYEGANAMLVQGLRDASYRSATTRANGPLTARSIVRVLEMANQIGPAVQGDVNGPNTLSHFLFRAYGFIFEVANDIDLPYYLPYQRCGACGGAIDVDLFESRRVDFARAQVQMVLDSLANPGGDMVYTQGSPKAYLKALEMATLYASMDLRESMGATSFACSALELQAISQRLCEFNGGSRVFYHNAPEAVAQSYYAAVRVLGEIGAASGCTSRPRYPYPYQP